MMVMNVWSFIYWFVLNKVFVNVYYLSVNYVLIINLINSNEIKDDNNDEVTKEHDNVLIDVN